MEFLEFKRFLMKSTNYMFSEQFYENISEAYLNQISKGDKGYVYFIQRYSDGAVKIGMSKDINKRLDSFLPYFNFKLIGFIYIENQSELEKELHNKFKDKRISGEFFDIPPYELHNLKDFVNININYNSNLKIMDGALLKSINKDVNESELFTKYFVDLLNFNGKNVYGEIYDKAVKKGYDGSRKKLTMMIKEYLLNHGIKFKDKRTATERYFIIEK